MNTMHAEKWGPLGAVIAATGCLGFTWLVGLVSAIGAGFLINDAIILPLLVVSMWGLWRSYRRHSRPYAFWTGSAGAVLLVTGIYFARPIAYAGVALLVTAPLLDLSFQLHRQREAASSTI